MPAQLEYSINQPVGYEGLTYDMHKYDAVSRSVETVAGIPFGKAVGRGTNLEKQIDLGGAAQNFVGITIRELSGEGTFPAGSIQYDEKDTAACMTRGYIWVRCPSGCVPSDPVKYDATTGVIDSGAAGAGEVQLNAQWDSPAAAGELGVVHLINIEATDGV